jgi:hypothetical protein
MNFSTLSWKRTSLMLACVGFAVLSACSNQSNTPVAETSPVALANHSVTPAFVKTLVSGLEVYSLVGSDDKLADSPNFVFGGSADGSGLLKNADGTFTALVNHEDNFSVSRITFDKTFKPTKGEYVLNSTAGKWRLCSATLTSQDVHGFTKYLTCGESGEESQTHLLDPLAPANSAIIAEGFGKWSAENAVPLPAATYAGQMVVIIGDDDSGVYGGQLAAYIGAPNDFQNGKLYVLARTDDNMRERDMVVGQKYNVVFRQVENQKTLTGRQINERATALKAIPFGRLEDVDYRKGSAAAAREVYFNATGQNNTGTNADYSRTKYGRVYRLMLDATDPLKGMLEVILDGDDRNGPAKTFQNVDNICVTENYVYTQEDPNGYKDETHDSYIYQYNIATREIKPVIELDHRRMATDADTYNTPTGTAIAVPNYGTINGRAGYGAWEYGAMIDISNIIGIPNTFMISIQPHTWRASKYLNVDGGTNAEVFNIQTQASQLVIIKGLPR